MVEDAVCSFAIRHTKYIGYYVTDERPLAAHNSKIQTPRNVNGSEDRKAGAAAKTTTTADQYLCTIPAPGAGNEEAIGWARSSIGFNRRGRAS